MQYAILYVNGDPFNVSPTDWTAAVNEWVGYMTDPDYVRINGKPAFFIINVGEMRQVFGTSAAVAGALQQLRAAAQAQSLPGVYVVGGFGVPNGTDGAASCLMVSPLRRMTAMTRLAFTVIPLLRRR